MEGIYIIGVGMTRFAKHLDRSLKSLVAEAVGAAFEDSGATPADVDIALFANTTQGIIDGQHAVRGQMALRPLGIGGVPILNIENACAGGGTAIHQAVAALRSGSAEVALAIGAEKMFDEDKTKIAAVFDGAWDIHEADKVVQGLSAIGGGVQPPAGTPSDVSSPFMQLYASLARGHMKLFGTTQRQMALVASKNHSHSTMNPLAQYQHPMSVDEVLAGSNIAWPLTLPMCSPISDGAAAALLCTASGLKRFPEAAPIRLRSVVLASGSDRQWEDFDQHLCRRAARQAYELAGVAPEDVSVAEVHDASAFAEIIQIENLGLCETGQGGRMSERMETTLGGRIPVNTSGGLVSKGHPISASGIAQIFELVTQLRGRAGARQVEGARLAVAENGGGWHGVEEAAAVVTVLST